MPFNMSVFIGKPGKYKCGVILIIGTFLYIIAFSAPYWVYESEEKYAESGWYAGQNAGRRWYNGLWQRCHYIPERLPICYSVHPVLFSGFFHNGAVAVQSLQCVGLVGLILATWNEVQTNFYDARLPCGYFTEITGGLGIVTGLTGAMVFVYGMQYELPTGWAEFKYSWCLLLDILGCGSCALSTYLTSKFKGYSDASCETSFVHNPLMAVLLLQLYNRCTAPSAPTAFQSRGIV